MMRKRLLVLPCLMTVVCFVVMPGAKAATKVGRFAYALEDGRIVAYAFDTTTGRLRTIQSVTLSTDALITVHPSNKFLYVPTGASSIAGFKIGATGLLTALAGSPFPTSFPPQGIYFPPSGKFGYTQGYPNSSVETFSVNATTGVLTSLGTVVAGSVIPDLAITPKGNFLYTANNGTSSISGLAINPTTGALTPVPGSPFSAGPGCATDWIHPSGKFVYCENFDGSISAYSINATTGSLTQISGSPFPGPPYAGNSSMRGTPNGHFLYVCPVTGGVSAFSVNQSTGALTVVPGSPFAAGAQAFAALADPSSSFLYVQNLAGSAVPILIFAIDPVTGALTQVAAEGLVGAEGLWLSFTTGAALKYTPTFAYVTNSGSNSIAELSIASGGLSFVTGSPITDTNGPQASVATASGTFLYTGNSNGSISEYSVGMTGALKKINGSPIRGLTNPVGMAISSFYNMLYAEDPTAEETFDYTINTKTGGLKVSFSGATDGVGPNAIAVDPFGQFTLVVNGASDEVAIGIAGPDFVGTVATGLNPAAITIDPSSQFVYVANSGDGTVSAYNLSLDSPYMTQIGAAVAAGTTPSAVVAEPYGRYLYVANRGSNSISAYNINALTGELTAISGTFTTQSGPSALSVSNDAKLLYVVDKDAGMLEQFTINADGTLTSAGTAALGTAPTSITAIGTYQ